MRTCDRPESCRLLAPENERTTQQTGSNTSEIGFAQPRGIESRNVPSTVRLFCFASVSGTLADACRPPDPACPATAQCCRSRGRAGVRAGPRVASRMDDQQERSQDCFFLHEESTRAPRSEGRWLARLTKGGRGPPTSETASKCGGGSPAARRALLVLQRCEHVEPRRTARRRDRGEDAGCDRDDRERGERRH